MSKTTTRNYESTIILDTRGLEETVETIIDRIKGIYTDLGAEVSEAKSLGQHDFIRITDRNHTGDSYLTVNYSGPADVPSSFQEKVRLDKTIKRVVTLSK